MRLGNLLRDSEPDKEGKNDGAGREVDVETLETLASSECEWRKGRYLHHRHVAYSVIAPPMSGPAAAPRLPKAIMIPSIPGRCCGETQEFIMVKPPFIIPAAPKPATALPKISMMELCAAPPVSYTHL